MPVLNLDGGDVDLTGMPGKWLIGTVKEIREYPANDKGPAQAALHLDIGDPKGGWPKVYIRLSDAAGLRTEMQVAVKCAEFKHFAER